MRIEFSINGSNYSLMEVEDVVVSSDKVEVEIWTSESGKECVQIFTLDVPERADGNPDIRVFVNEGPVYGGYDGDS